MVLIDGKGTAPESHSGQSFFTVLFYIAARLLSLFVRFNPQVSNISLHYLIDTS